MVSLGDMLMQRLQEASGDDEDDAPKKRGSRDHNYGVTISTEGQIANLEEMNEFYQEMRDDGAPFEVGDFVTPRASSTIKGHGFPHIVLEVVDPDLVFSPTKAQSDIHFGQRCNIRVACHVADETIASYWGESWQYEKFETE